MFLYRFLAITALTVALAPAAHALTAIQETVMHRHGNWEWSIGTCPGIHRGRRYWYFLQEAGRFDRIRQITENEGGPAFNRGWQEMERHAEQFGTDATCDLAMQKWPAILWRQDK
ncbi:MAG: hypothetical protein ACR2PI_04245 [Hyphomicrobiaceae bacterium]